MPLGHVTTLELCEQDPRARQMGHCRCPGAGAAGEQREGWEHRALRLAVATLLERRVVSLRPRLSLSRAPPNPLASHTWTREDIDQDAAAGSRVAVVGGADPGIGGDQHSGGPRVDGGSLGSDLAAAFASQQDRPGS